MKKEILAMPKDNLTISQIHLVNNKIFYVSNNTRLIASDNCLILQEIDLDDKEHIKIKVAYYFSYQHITHLTTCEIDSKRNVIIKEFV